MSLDQFYQQMQQEHEMHYMTSVNDVITAFEYHGISNVLESVFANRPNLKHELYEYIKKYENINAVHM
jgi:hypothetical protein